MNTINLFGRLTAEPELKTAKENKYVKFCVAVDRRTKEKKTDFIDCIAWNKLVEIICNYCHKGNFISITGSLQTSIYETNGEKKKSCEVYVTSIDLVGGQTKPAENDATADNDHLQFEPNFDIQDGELPFKV